jgi:hypothetical protein
MEKEKRMKTSKQTTQFILNALALGLYAAAQAAAPVIEEIIMVPRLTIRSDLGTTNQILYSTDLGQTQWT